MMVLGMPGFSDAQNRVHMALWAMSGAPLLVGADLAKLSPETLATLTNKEVLAIDQDALGLQAVKVAEPEKGIQVWSKILSGAGKRAVLLLNRTAAPANISVRAQEIGLSESARAKDPWSGKDLGEFSGSYSAQVPAGNAVLLLVNGSEVPGADYKPEPQQDEGQCRGCEVVFARVSAHAAWARVRITYRNSSKAPRYVEFHVNGQGPTSVALPPVGASAGEISVMAQPDRTGAANRLVFASDSDLTGVIDAINVE
jgi:alpha galactosidase C-like protein/alpha-galactosidase-like CBM13-containing protein/alpha galactosidase A-like protein